MTENTSSSSEQKQRHAINNDKKVPTHWKVIAKCSDNARLTKESDVKFG